MAFCACVCGALLTSAGKEADPPSAKQVIVMRLGVDGDMCRKIVDFVRGNVPMTVRLVSAKGRIEGDQPSKDLARTISKAFDDTNTVCVAVLVPVGSGLDKDFMMRPDGKTLFVKVHDSDKAAVSGESRNQAVQSAQRLCMYGVGRALGIPDCIDPRCAMSANLFEWRKGGTGRNYCPACLGKVEEILRRR